MHQGIVDLARETDACIVVAGVFLPVSRFILERTWDRTQLPRPFSTLTGRFRPPIDPRDFDDPPVLAAELLALEQAFDPDEARHAGRVPGTVSAARQRSRSIVLSRTPPSYTAVQKSLGAP